MNLSDECAATVIVAVAAMGMIEQKSYTLHTFMYQHLQPALVINTFFEMFYIKNLKTIASENNFSEFFAAIYYKYSIHRVVLPPR